MPPLARRALVPVAFVCLLSGFQAPAPEDQLAAVAKVYLSLAHPADWDGLEKLPGIRWAALPPTSLRSCLPNGDCYARQGAGTVGGRNFAMVASGARTMVVHLLIRNLGAPIGGPAIVAALERAGFTTALARCPVRPGAGGTSWYRIAGEGAAAGFLAIQPAGPGRPNEGYGLTHGDELPALQPNQLALYSEQCAPGAERKPAATTAPHEALAGLVVTLLAPAGGPPLYDWAALGALPTGIEWVAGGPKAVDLTVLGDPNPVSQSGSLTLSGRKFSVRASGTAAQVKAIHLEESGLHPRGEHLLGVVHQKGVAVRLVRCGPVYTESTNNWYSLESPRTRSAAIRQSIRYDGNRVQDSYQIRLDGTLPPRDPRDRDPGRNGC